MSYILDALKRSERERAAPPAALAAPVRARPVRQGRLVLAACAGLLLLNGLGLAGWALLRQHPPRQTQTVTPAPVPHAASAPRSELALAAAARGSGSRRPEPGPGPAAADEAPRDSAAVPASPPTDTNARAAASAAEKSSAPRVSVTDEPPPLLSTLPASFQAEVSPLTVEVHVYAERPGSRFVIVDGHSYHEGDRLARGPRIVSITESGMVLSYKGRRFRVGLR